MDKTIAEEERDDGIVYKLQWDKGHGLYVIKDLGKREYKGKERRLLHLFPVYDDGLSHERSSISSTVSELETPAPRDSFEDAQDWFNQIPKSEYEDLPRSS